MIVSMLSVGEEDDYQLTNDDANIQQYNDNDKHNRRWQLSLHWIDTGETLYVSDELVMESKVLETWILLVRVTALSAFFIDRPVKMRWRVVTTGQIWNYLF